MKRGNMPAIIPFSELPAAAWTAAALQPESPMQCREWLAAAAEVYGNNEAMAVVSGSVERPSGLAVLGKAAGGRLKQLGAIDTGEPVAVLAASDAAAVELARGVIKLGRAVSFGHYPTASAFLPALRRISRGRGVVVTRPLPDGAFPTIELDDRWSDPEQAIGGKRRRELRRKRRRAEQTGPVVDRIITPQPAEVDPLLERMIAVEARSWKSRSGTSLSQDKRQAAFLRNYAHRAAENGLLRMCFLEIGGTAAAAAFAVVWQNRFWMIKIGYDEAFSGLGPGELLTFELIRHAVAHGLETFEFCGKESGWTRQWTDVAQEISAVRFYPFNLSGVVALVADTLQLGRTAWSRRLSKALPSRLESPSEVPASAL